MMKRICGDEEKRKKLRSAFYWLPEDLLLACFSNN
jgi:hypothetical protein